MAGADRLLEPYRQKRDFDKTAEPSGAGAKRARGAKSRAQKPIFVVQQHDATRLHWDFRLEMDGVLKSWAVTRGPSTNPKEKRLAVRVEDHPLDYAEFEGVIPEGEYGGGTVMLWDRGTWEPIGDPHQGLEAGDLKIRLFGERMKGEWVLVHMKGRDSGKRQNWLLIKHYDEFASVDDDLVPRNTTSISTGRDLGAIAAGAKPEKGAKPARLVSTKAETSAATLPEFVPPQLATLVDHVPEGRDWLFEMKYDGYRCLAAVAGGEAKLFTRNANDWTRQFAAMQEPLSRLTSGSALIDGEICAFNKDGRADFSTLKDALSTGGPLVYFVFDLLEENGEDLRRLPLIERKERLKALVGTTGKASPIQYSDHVRGNGQQVFDAMCEGGYEGVIAKRAKSLYSGERSKSWLKVKCLHRQEFVIAGWSPSEKKKTFASLLVGTWDSGKLVYRGRVGTGYTADEAEALQLALDKRARSTSPFEVVPRAIERHAHWVEPELVCEVAFTEFTPDNIMRHPSYVGLREDKPARQIKLEKPAPLSEVVSKPGKDKPVAAAPAANETLTDKAGMAAADKAGVRLTSPERVVFPDQNLTKAELVAYYAKVSDRMLPFIKDRPLSFVRCPQGRSKSCFFQKHDSGGFPDALKTVEITEKEGDTENYFYLQDLAGILAAVQMNVLEFHLWGSRRQAIERPERIIFDIDPDEGLDFEAVRDAAQHLRGGLETLGLQSFPMVTGGKGVHVIAPLTGRAEWPEVKAFCKGFAQFVADAEPQRFVAVMSKARRKGKLFIDYLRNERGSTAISPFSTRSRAGAPVAVPISWDELPKLPGANVFSVGEAAERAMRADPWKGYFDIKQSITPAMIKAVRGVVE